MLVAVILARLGLSWWSVVLAVIALGCPVSALYGWWLSQRMAVSVDAVVPYTTGMTMGWAAPYLRQLLSIDRAGLAVSRTTLRHAGVADGEQVLDVGCGTGV